MHISFCIAIGCRMEYNADFTMITLHAAKTAAYPAASLSLLLRNYADSPKHSSDDHARRKYSL